MYISFPAKPHSFHSDADSGVRGVAIRFTYVHTYFARIAESRQIRQDTVLTLYIRKWVEYGLGHQAFHGSPFRRKFTIVRKDEGENGMGVI